MNPSQQGALLTTGFGTTVVMWAVGYFCHIPPAVVPSPVVLFLLLDCLFVGGWIAGMTSSRGWMAGLQTGLVTGALNLLILGSLISGDQPNQIVPSALIWIPGSFLVCALMGFIGAFFGYRYPVEVTWNWTSAFSWVGASATFLLLLIGGVVTGNEAGLSVVDWPNSFGYNMFLYPLSRMTGGIYFEHAHRLFGSLVGLTTLTLAFHLYRTETRRWIRTLGFVALCLVIVQGVMGGLRVTGHLTLSTSPSETHPNLLLAMGHGVLGQVFFALMVALAVLTSNAWTQPVTVIRSTTAKMEKSFSIFLILLVLIQIATGAILRHTTFGLMIHITCAVLVAAVAVLSGIRAWGLYPGQKKLQRIGLGLISLISLQLFLGLMALYAIGIERTIATVPNAIDVIVTTIHQVTGAVILAVSVLLFLWIFHIFENE